MTPNRRMKLAGHGRRLVPSTHHRTVPAGAGRPRRGPAAHAQTFGGKDGYPMTLPSGVIQAIDAELSRLGLARSALPGLAFSGVSAGERLLAHLRSFSPGVSWPDIFPGLADDGPPPDLSRWRARYGPLGTWDRPTPPTGPAVHVIWRGPETSDWLTSVAHLVEQAGHPLYNVGRSEASNMPADHGFVVWSWS